MKVLKNNYEARSESYPKVHICEVCRSELEYNKSDLRMGEYGYVYLDCPLCGCDNMLEDNEESITLTVDNIEFPIHFHHISKETGAVDRCNTEEIRKEIKRAVEYFRKNKEEYAWHTWCGNLFVLVHKWSDDEEYQVTISNDFYEMEIPFESQDY